MTAQETPESNQEQLFKVVLNDEEQYSIWPLHKPNAPGWSDAGMQGTKQECLTHIASVWHDLRPRSLRESMS